MLVILLSVSCHHHVRKSWDLSEHAHNPDFPFMCHSSWAEYKYSSSNWNLLVTTFVTFDVCLVKSFLIIIILILRQPVVTGRQGDLCATDSG